MKRLMAMGILAAVLATMMATVAAAEQKPIWVETSRMVRPMEQGGIWVE